MHFLLKITGLWTKSTVLEEAALFADSHHHSHQFYNLSFPICKISAMVKGRTIFKFFLNVKKLAHGKTL